MLNVVNACVILAVGTSVACDPTVTLPSDIPGTTSGDTSSTSTDTGTVVDEPSPGISLTLSPDVVSVGDVIAMDVVIEDYTLVDPTAAPPPTPTDGEGHYHVYFDDVYAAALWEEGTVEFLILPEDAPGTHALSVVLVDSAHAELDPPVREEAMFTVQ